MKHRLLSLLCCLGLLACQSAPIDDPRLHAYTLPQHGLTQGPDGWYLTRQDGPWGTNAKQSVVRLRDGRSEVQAPAWASAEHSDSDFSYSEAHARGCFISTRPLPAQPDRTDANIWCSDWTGNDWASPVPLPAPINSPEGEWSPVLAADGTLYFASDRPGGCGLGDIYEARHESGVWSVAALPDTINASGGEWNLDISPDGQRLIFEASHRKTNKSVPGDLYISTRTLQGWSEARPLADLNTTGSDLMPRFIGNRRFIFTSVENGVARFRIAEIP